MPAAGDNAAECGIAHQDAIVRIRNFTSEVMFKRLLNPIATPPARFAGGFDSQSDSQTRGNEKRPCRGRFG